MKKRLYFPFIIVLFSLNACNQFYDDIQPQDDLPIEVVYQSVNDLETALIGVYNTLQGEGLAGLNLIQFGDLLSCNGRFTQTGYPETFDIARQQLRASNYYAEETWVAAYKAINEANLILAALETVADANLTEAIKNRIKGEARFIRGVLYFELARLYAVPYDENTRSEPGVPLMIEPVSKQGDLLFPSRATIEAVYGQAEADISAAKNLLPESMTYDKANANAAIAYLAKMSFQKREYDVALERCNELFQSELYQLTEIPQDVFDNTKQPSTEMIWVVAYTSSDPAGDKVFWMHESRALIFVNDDLKTAFANIITQDQLLALETEDLSVIDLRVDTSGFAGNLLMSDDWKYTNKYEGVVGFADDTPMARLSEFVLMKAEILARDGDKEESIGLLNQIRARSLRVLDAAGNEVPDKLDLVLFEEDDFSADELIEAIIMERRVELCFEGNFLQDMKRLKRDICGLPYDDCKLTLPIPQREIDVNQNLEQNECY